VALNEEKIGRHKRERKLERIAALTMEPKDRAIKSCYKRDDTSHSRVMKESELGRIVGKAKGKRRGGTTVGRKKQSRTRGGMRPSGRMRKREGRGFTKRETPGEDLRS